jgi:hypothetical protein
MSLKKPRNTCKDKCIRTRAIIYAWYILAFKHHGVPPGKKGLYCLFLWFSFLLTTDIMLTVSMCSHIFGPITNFKTVGIPFLFIYPLISILAPLFGLVGCLLGSVDLLKRQITMNATLVLINYPLTIVTMWFIQDEPAYIGIVGILTLSKILISFFGAKVRQHLVNPGFIVNQKKFQEFAEYQNSTMSRFPRARILTAVDHDEDDFES